MVRAMLFQYWRRIDVVPSRQPAGPAVVCRDAICVLQIGLTDQRNWNDVVVRLTSQDACPPLDGVCFDCEQIWIKTVASGKYREQSCQEPPSWTLARELLDLMKASAQAAR